MLQMVSGEGVPCGGGWSVCGGGGRAECGLELYHVFYSGTCLKSLKNDFVTFIRAVVYLVTFFLS